MRWEHLKKWTSDTDVEIIGLDFRRYATSEIRSGKLKTRNIAPLSHSKNNNHLPTHPARCLVAEPRWRRTYAGRFLASANQLLRPCGISSNGAILASRDGHERQRGLHTSEEIILCGPKDCNHERLDQCREKVGIDSSCLLTPATPFASPGTFPPLNLALYKFQIQFQVQRRSPML